MDPFTHLLFQIGDRVTLRQDRRGTVVGVIERGEFAADVDASRWRDHYEGLIVRMSDGLHIHVQSPETMVTAWSGGKLP